MSEEFEIIIEGSVSCRIPVEGVVSGHVMAWFIGRCGEVAVSCGYGFGYGTSYFVLLGEDSERMNITCEHQIGADIIYLTAYSSSNDWQVLGSFWELLKDKGLVVRGFDELPKKAEKESEEKPASSLLKEQDEKREIVVDDYKTPAWAYGVFRGLPGYLKDVLVSFARPGADSRKVRFYWIEKFKGQTAYSYFSALYAAFEITGRTIDKQVELMRMAELCRPNIGKEISNFSMV